MSRNRLCVHIGWSIVCFIISTLSLKTLQAQSPTTPAVSPKPTSLRRTADGLYTIENSQVRVGINTNYGGAITYMAFANDQNGQVSTQNMINNNDLGRQSQIALYGGPLDYSKNGSGHWINLGWDPIQAGSTQGDVSQVLSVEKQDNLLYAKTVPKQFALKNEPGEAYIEHWIRLEGNLVKVHAKVTLFRADKTQYEGRQQEFPCLYTNGDYHNIWGYTKEAPYTNAPLELRRIKPSENMFYEDAFPTEPWMATTNDNGYGVGLFVPNNLDFKRGYFGQELGGDEFSGTAAYVGATPHIVLDHDIVYEWDYVYIVGNLDQIRSYVYSQPRPSPKPNFRFDTSRKGWYYQRAQDTGWRVDGKLHVLLDNAATARITSPYVFWKGRENPKVYIRAAFKTQTDTFKFNWRRNDDQYMYASSDRFVELPVINDGQYHTYAVDLSANPNWLDYNIGQIELSPITTNDSPGAWVEIAWIASSPDGPTPEAVTETPDFTQPPVVTNPPATAPPAVTTPPVVTEPSVTTPVITNPPATEPPAAPVATNPGDAPVVVSPPVANAPVANALCVPRCVLLQIKKIR